MRDRTKLLLIVGGFLIARFLPADSPRTGRAIVEAFAMLHEYARDHVVLCLVPALFLAGAIGVFVSQAAVTRTLGFGAPKRVAYPVAAISGSVLAVCSCTVLPLFAGIHRRGAGLGPATAFLYAGPAVNVLALVLTARVLGPEMGIARAVGAVGFSVVIGLAMQLLFRKEERERAEAATAATGSAAAPAGPARGLRREAVVFAALIGVLVFANWGRPSEADGGLWVRIHDMKWVLAGGFLVVLGVTVPRWFSRDELGEWGASTWGFALQILPLLLGGVLVAGFLLGRPGHEGMIPSRWVTGLVGGNGLPANFFAAAVGALTYFATLTEVPILQGLLGAGMGKGPALSLLLAGPALSLPSMLVIRSVLGNRKTLVYIALVVGMSTVAGLAYGAITGSQA